jgi:hypothetical protein
MCSSAAERAKRVRQNDLRISRARLVARRLHALVGQRVIAVPLAFLTPSGSVDVK